MRSRRIARILFLAAAAAPAAAFAAARAAAQEASGAGAPGTADAEVREGIARVRTLCNQERYPEAARAAEELAKSHEESFEAWLALAYVHLDVGWQKRRDARAESASRRALRIAGRRPEILQALAAALFREAKVEECGAILDELVDGEPPAICGDALADMLSLRATLALQHEVLDAGSRARAVADLKRALVAAPDHAFSHLTLAQILMADGDAAQALTHLEAAERVSPGDLTIHYQLHLCLTRLHRKDEAKRHYEIWRLMNRLTDSNSKAIAVDPPTRREILTKLKELNPADLSSRLELVRIELALNDPAAAIRECDELLAVRPDLSAAQHLRGEAQAIQSGAKPPPGPAQGGGEDHR